MNDLEGQIRASLRSAAPEHVETAGLAQGARTRAARRRRGVLGGALLAAALVLGVGVAVVSQNQPSALPARPGPTASIPPADRDLCSLKLPNVTADGPRAEPIFSRIALCPLSPTDPAWAELPLPAVVHDRRTVGVADLGGGPPVETCDNGRPELPAFRLVLMDANEDGSYLSSGGLECSGALAAQAFGAALARERFAATSDAPCSPWDEVATRRGGGPTAGITSVEVCVAADPYVEAEPSPLRVRPVRHVVLRPADADSVVLALTSQPPAGDRWVDCPYRGVWVSVIVSRGRTREVVGTFRCEQDMDAGVTERLAEMMGRWSVLDARGQAVIEREVAGYLDGRLPR